jgi:hypothetical protein
MILITVMSLYKIFIELSIRAQASRSRENVTLRLSQTPVRQSHTKWPILETAQYALHDTSRANQKTLQKRPSCSEGNNTHRSYLRKFFYKRIDLGLHLSLPFGLCFACQWFPKLSKPCTFSSPNISSCPLFDNLCA